MTIFLFLTAVLSVDLESTLKELFKNDRWRQIIDEIGQELKSSKLMDSKESVDGGKKEMLCDDDCGKSDGGKENGDGEKDFGKKILSLLSLDTPNDENEKDGKGNEKSSVDNKTKDAQGRDKNKGSSKGRNEENDERNDKGNSKGRNEENDKEKVNDKDKGSNKEKNEKEGESIKKDLNDIKKDLQKMAEEQDRFKKKMMKKDEQHSTSEMEKSTERENERKNERENEGKNERENKRENEGKNERKSEDIPSKTKIRKMDHGQMKSADDEYVTIRIVKNGSNDEIVVEKESMSSTDSEKQTRNDDGQSSEKKDNQNDSAELSNDGLADENEQSTDKKDSQNEQSSDKKDNQNEQSADKKDNQNEQSTDKKDSLSDILTNMKDSQNERSADKKDSQNADDSSNLSDKLKNIITIIQEMNKHTKTPQKILITYDPVTNKITIRIMPVVEVNEEDIKLINGGVRVLNVFTENKDILTSLFPKEMYGKIKDVLIYRNRNGEYEEYWGKIKFHKVGDNEFADETGFLSGQLVNSAEEIVNEGVLTDTGFFQSKKMTKEEMNESFRVMKVLISEIARIKNKRIVDVMNEELKITPLDMLVFVKNYRERRTGPDGCVYVCLCKNAECGDGCDDIKCVDRTKLDRIIKM